jgi:hypothetical protein
MGETHDEIMTRLSALNNSLYLSFLIEKAENNITQLNSLNFVAKLFEVLLKITVRCGTVSHVGGSINYFHSQPPKFIHASKNQPHVNSFLIA